MRKEIIQYLWIDKWRSYESIDFNFSSKYNFKYDEYNNELTCQNKNQDYCNDFFGNNVDITAIVGQNGAGKTSLIDYLIEVFSNDNFSQKFIVAIEVRKENTEQIIICLNEISDIKFDFDSLNIEIKKAPKNYIKEHEFVTILYNYAITNHHYYCSDDMFFNLTTSNLINQSGKSYANNLNSYHINERKMQLDFLFRFGGYVRNFGIKYPEDVEISFHFQNIYSMIDRFSNDYYQYINMIKNDIKRRFNNSFFEEEKEYLNKCISFSFANDINNFLRNVFFKPQSEKKEKFCEYISISLFSELLSLLYYYSANLEQGKFFVVLFELIDKIYDNFKENALLNAKYIVSEIRELMNKLNLLIPEIDHVSKSRWVMLSKVPENFENYLSFIEVRLLNDDFFMSTCKGERFKLKMNLTNEDSVTVKEFFEEYRKISCWFDFLGFDFKMSSGEIALLSLYSRFYSVFLANRIGSYKHKQIELKDKNILILLDEAEALYHPEWQKKYISCIVAFFKEVFVDSHLQIIVATHSPIILSDVPRQNVVYLKKNEKGKTLVDEQKNHAETFGANIFRLYNDSFFLIEGSIGEFAENKIKELIESIDKKPIEMLEEIKKRIEMLGDEFLKSKIKSRFVKKLDTYNKILILEEEIARLKREEGEISDKNF